MAVSADWHGRIALLSRHTREVDFGSGAVTALQGQLCDWLRRFAGRRSSLAPGIAAAAYGPVACGPTGRSPRADIAVARFDSDGAVRWVRRFDPGPARSLPSRATVRSSS